MVILAKELNDELLTKFLNTVSSSYSTLTLALKLIMSYELSLEQKLVFKEFLVNNNLFYFNHDWNEVKTHMFLNQIFNDAYYMKITSWQVRVCIHELKHLIGSGNEMIYCILKIGEKEFKTKEMHIDKLKFDFHDQIFIARIDNCDYQKAFNYKITITVKI